MRKRSCRVQHPNKKLFTNIIVGIFCMFASLLVVNISSFLPQTEAELHWKQEDKNEAKTKYDSTKGYSYADKDGIHLKMAEDEYTQKYWNEVYTDHTVEQSEGEYNSLILKFLGLSNKIRYKYYTLDSIEDFAWFCREGNKGNLFEKCFVFLDCSVDLSEYIWKPVKNFKGNFIGSGNTISGLRINYSDDYGA